MRVALAILFSLLASAGVAAGQDADERPNIVLILVDDAALMDFGAYGGEAATPNIDALAQRGAWFTQYRTSPLCSPTRAMLLTGLDNHLTGVATIPEVLPEEHAGQPGYTMALEPGVLTLADRLGSIGYRTLMSGKWHLGETPEEMPQNHGFDRSFALAASGADNWADKSYMPYYADAPWYEDGAPAKLPEDFYSSQFIVDQMISYLADTPSEQPFFAYLPFQAIHIPVQAPDKFIANYDGRFDEGWHEMRRARYERAQTLGLVPEGVPYAPIPQTDRRWESLSDEERTLYAARMEVNAAMLEAMDHHIGRLIQYLESQSKLEKTIFVVTSDNGPEPNRGDYDQRLEFWMGLNGYHTELDGIGGIGSWGFIGPEWANAAASPSQLYKFYATEGGVRAPLIISGPGVTPARVDSPAMVTDVAPTLLDMVTDGGSSALTEMTGRSLLPVLSGAVESVYADDDIRAIEVSGNSALYLGDYKITRSMPPVGDGDWRLYNLALDPGETQDISELSPDIKDILVQAFEGYAEEFGVLAMPAGFDSHQQITKNTMKRLQMRYGWMLILIVLLLLGLVYGLWRGGRWIAGRVRG